MNDRTRYDNERDFSDSFAERTLAKMPPGLRLAHIRTFEELCENVGYLRSAPRFLGNLSGKRVLDMGCGNGWVSLHFAKSGAEVWACDISPRVIEVASRYVKAADLRVAFETMVCEELTYEDNFFDCIFMHMALHHCDIAKTAAQICRVLKPGGKAVLAEDYAYHPLMNLYRRITPDKHTANERPLTDEDLSSFASQFSSCDLEFSGLFNLLETSARKSARSLIPILRRVDDVLIGNFAFLKRYTRIVLIKAIK